MPVDEDGEYIQPVRDPICPKHKCKYVYFCMKCKWGDNDDPGSWVSELTPKGW